MLLTLALPQLNDLMLTGIIGTLHVAEGTEMTPGSKLLDVTVDLSDVAPQDCPPVSYYRIAVRERVWLRRLDVAAGDDVPTGTVLAHFSTDPDEPLDAPSARPLRVTIAGILGDSEGWGEEPS